MFKFIDAESTRVAARGWALVVRSLSHVRRENRVQNFGFARRQKF